MVEDKIYRIEEMGMDELLPLKQELESRVTDLGIRVSELKEELSTCSAERLHLSKVTRRIRNRMDELRMDSYKDALFIAEGGEVPKETLEKIWVKAWEDSRHDGLDAVKDNFVELVEILK